MKQVKKVLILCVMVLSVCLVGTAQPTDDCRTTHPNPQIKFDHQDSAGRVYIPVVNWSVYPNEMFRKAPELPPCGANTNSARTWVDIYDANTNTKVYGFCALGSNEGLKGIWFSSNAKSGRVYIVLRDRACEKNYRSNTLIWGQVDDCRTTHPNPQIKFDHQDSEGRVYIPVVNWSVYPNEMFRQAPELPPCGANTNSARTWVDIYDAKTNARVYGFCALDSNEGLKGIWFSSKAKGGMVYIILKDRACKKEYRSNTLRWGLQVKMVKPEKLRMQKE